MSILARILKAKPHFKPIVRDGYNPHYKSRFASLDSILDAVEPALGAEGIIIINQVIDGALRTTLLSEDGELCSTFPLPTGTDPQKLGASITYGRRYNLSALLNLRTDDDDDGNSAAPQRSQSATAPKRSRLRSGSLDNQYQSNGDAIAQMQESDRLLSQLGWDTQRGADALGRVFPGKRSRHQLSADELAEFNQILSRELTESATESAVGGLDR